jgi:hypothetical protein
MMFGPDVELPVSIGPTSVIWTDDDEYFQIFPTALSIGGHWREPVSGEVWEISDDGTRDKELALSPQVRLTHERYEDQVIPIYKLRSSWTLESQ